MMKHSATPSTDTFKRSALIAAGLLAFLALLYVLAPVLTPFVVAAIVAYILNPLVIRLAALKLGRFKLSRTLAAGVVMVLLILAIVALVLLVVPVLRSEAALLQGRLPALLEQANTVWLPFLHQHLGISIKLDTASVKQWLASLSAGDDVATRVLAAAKTGGTAVLGFVGTGLLALVLAFYLLMDWPAIVARVVALVPKRWAALLARLTGECDQVLGQYLRGQLAVMLALAVYYSVALWIAGFDVALPVGVLTGLLVVIPYLGFVLGLILALAAAVLQFAGFTGLIWVAVIYGVGQMLESFFLTPRWVGASLGLHPAAVIFALMAFGQLLGCAGVLLALPLAAVVVVVGKAALAHYHASDWYKQA